VPAASGPEEDLTLTDEELDAAQLVDTFAAPAGGAAGASREPTPISQAPTAHRARFAPLPDPIAQPTRSGLDLLSGLQLEVRVELGRTRLTVADVLGLGPGSVIELDRLAGEPVDILVNDRLIARGEVVVVDENFGVRVVEVIRRQAEPEERAG
jgi:flagellar motor switch protein FliN/FliY